MVSETPFGLQVSSLGNFWDHFPKVKFLNLQTVPGFIPES